MDKNQLTATQRYLEQHALPLDLALYKFHFQDGTSQSVLDELATWQNKDGGFRGSLEHDARLPQSTAVATWTALRIMREVSADKDSLIMQRCLEYLVDSYDQQYMGWPIVCPEVDNYPHAPWWTYETAMAGFGWGNPSAELLGFLMKYGDSETAQLGKMLRDKALARIHELDESADFHEVLTFKGLYELAGDDLKQQLKEPLGRLIRATATVDPEQWKTYSAPPLRFVNSPDDPFIELFDEELVTKNLAFLEESPALDHWEPNWDWGDAYPEAWQQAKQEWSGQWTVKNLVTLKNFKRLET